MWPPTMPTCTHSLSPSHSQFLGQVELEDLLSAQHKELQVLHASQWELDEEENDDEEGGDVPDEPPEKTNLALG